MINHCVLAEPKNGEVWSTVASSPRNASKNTEELLNLVVQKLEE